MLIGLINKNKERKNINKSKLKFHKIIENLIIILLDSMIEIDIKEITKENHIFTKIDMKKDKYKYRPKEEFNRIIIIEEISDNEIEDNIGNMKENNIAKGQMIFILNKNIVRNYPQNLTLHLQVHLLHKVKKVEVEVEIKKYIEFKMMKKWSTKIIEETFKDKFIMIESPKIKKDHHKDKEYTLFIMIDKENIQN